MLRMVNNVVIRFTVVLFCYKTFAVNADCNDDGSHLKEASKHAALTPLHHIIEFRKRDQIKRIGCKNNVANKKPGLTNVTNLGLHGLLHVRSQKIKEQTGTRREVSPDVPEVIVLKHHENTSEAKIGGQGKSAHKLQVRKMAINLLRNIVEEHFPGGKLTVEQKIKALKLLGKIMKLKVKNNKLDIKAAIDAMSGNGGALAHNKTAQMPQLNKETNGNNEGSDSGHKTDDSDLYAAIANGPDVPKLPPGIAEKDPEHANSHLMPVGIPSIDGYGNPSMHQGSDIKDNFHNMDSEYSNNQNPYGNNFGEGHIYNTGDFYSGKTELGGMSMMDDSAYARSRMPFSPRFRHRVTYEQDNRASDDDDEDDDFDDDDDDGEEEGQARSYVNRNSFDDENDDDDDDDVGYRHRFERKNKIAKLLKNNTKTDTSQKSSTSKL